MVKPTTPSATFYSNIFMSASPPFQYKPAPPPATKIFIAGDPVALAAPINPH
jgi:hypothetical protein